MPAKFKPLSGDAMKHAGVPRQWGDERRSWHLDKTISMSAIVAIVIGMFSLAGMGILWYTQVEGRIENQQIVTEELQERDERLSKRLETNEKRWRQALAEQERRTERRFDQLRDQLQSVNDLLRQIVMNTKERGG